MATYKAPDTKETKKKKHKQDKIKEAKATPQPGQKNNNNNKSNKGRYTVVTIIIIVMVLAAAGVAAFLIFRGQNAQNNPNTNATGVASVATDATTPHSVEQKDMPVLKSDDGSDGYQDGAVYIWNNKGYELFKGNVKTAVSYAQAINNYKTALGSNINVYDMVVPNNTEFGLPERLGKDISNPQRDNTEAVITNLSADVTPIDVYNILGEHRNDYIFFNTDENWTALGAYYAYTEFTKAAGIEAKNVSALTHSTIDTKLPGSYIAATVSEETANGNPKLLSNLDTVEYYELPQSCTVSAMADGATSETEDAAFYNTEISDNSTIFKIYATADSAYTVIKNSDVKDGSKIAIVADSYGQAIAPFLAQNYSEVHIINMTNFKRNLKTYCTDNKITNVLFLNGIMSANSAAQLEKTDAMFD